MLNVPYDAVVGSVMCLMLCTMPNLAFAIRALRIYMSNPGVQHWMAMKYILRYILGTKHLGLVFGKYGTEQGIKGFVDSDYSSNKDNRKLATSFYLLGLVMLFLGSLL